MAAFEKAVGFLSKNPEFAGSSRRATRSSPARRAGSCGWPPGRRPTLPEPRPFVVHEIHRVPLAQQEPIWST